MAEQGMLQGARKLLTLCTHTQASESVLIVTDPKLKGLAQPLALAAAEVGAEATICLMPVRTTHGQEPPAPVAAAMAAADVFRAGVGLYHPHPGSEGGCAGRDAGPGTDRF